MATLLPFIIEKEDKLELNDEVLDKIKNSQNPRFILSYGDTRQGKSTTLNQLIRDNKKSLKFMNSFPFKSFNSAYSITKGCDIYGPIKASELINRHDLNINLENDFDVFFCDTEGLSSLDGIQTKSIPGILTLLEICTISISIVHNTIKMNDVKNICSQIQLSNLIEKNFIKPLVTIYISNIFINDNENENEEDEDEDFEKYIEKYKKSEEFNKNRILNEVNNKYPELNFKNEDFEVIAGGPFQSKKKEPNPDDIEVKLYWNSIHELMSVLFKHKGDDINQEEIIDYINILFGIFSKIDIKNIKDDFNIENFVKNLMINSFEEYSNNKFQEKINKIKEEIKNNFINYIEILKDDNKAKESLNSCLNKNYYNIYNKLIPDKIISFIDTSIEKYRNLIQKQIDEEFDFICNNIISEDNINSLIQNIVSMINNSEFKEDINMDLINQKEKLWDDIYEKNKIILNYFTESKPVVIDNLKERFLSTINSIFQKLLEEKKIWSDFLKDSLLSIEKEINKSYIEMFNKCDYEEDIEKYIEKDDIFYEKIINNLNDTYYKNVSEKRIKEANEEIKNICKEEYNKILNNKLPQWNNLKKEICTRIKEIIDSYLFKIFKGKEFKDEIDPKLGEIGNFKKIIPSNIKENNQIKKSRENEINNILENEVENGVKLFNNQRDKLPLFKEYIENKIKFCTNIIDDKIKKLLTQFHYLEDKIQFNSDSFFYLLSNNQEIYNNCGNKIKEINDKIRELCDKKSKEYDSLVIKQKPEWNKIKSEKIVKIQEICENFEKKIFENVYFKEDVKQFNKYNLQKLINQISDLYKDVDLNKKNEINSKINEYIEKTNDKINAKKNTLANWKMIKTQLIQKSIIEMTNKSKNELGSTNIYNIVRILCQHMESFTQNFYECKTEEKKNEIRIEIRNNAELIAREYINRKEEEERRRREEEERRRREEEEKRRREEEEKRIWREEQQRILTEMQQRIWREEEERRKREEQQRIWREEQQRIWREDQLRILREEEERRRREEERRREEQQRIYEKNYYDTLVRMKNKEIEYNYINENKEKEYLKQLAIQKKKQELAEKANRRKLLNYQLKLKQEQRLKQQEINLRRQYQEKLKEYEKEKERSYDFEEEEEEEG